MIDKDVLAGHNVGLVKGIFRTSGPEKQGHVCHPLRVCDGVHVLDEIVAETPVSVTETPRYQVDVNVQLLELVLRSSPAGNEICLKLFRS